MTQPLETGRREIRLIARREFVERGRDKSFLISATVTTLIIVAIVVLPALFSKPTTYHLGAVGSQARQVADAAASAATASDVKTSIVALADENAARAAVTAGDVDVALLDGQHALAKETLTPELTVLLLESARNLRLGDRLTTAGVSAAEAQQLLGTPPLTITALKPKSPDDKTRQGIALLTVIVLYGQLIGYVMWVANGVVEEKASRVIEVLAATVKPIRLMVGKVIGIAGLAVVQLVGVTGIAISAAVTVGKTRIPPDAYGSVALSFLWFLAGFAFFAFLSAGAASMVSRQEDLQNVITPLTLVLVGSLFAGLQAAQSPGSTLARVLSFVPPVSSVVMPPRFAAGGVPVWHVFASFALLLVAVVGVARMSARVYENSILKQRSKWREALRAGKGRAGTTL